MKSRFGTKTVALTLSVRRTPSTAAGNDTTDMYYFINENPSPHINDVVTKMLTNTTVDIRIHTYTHLSHIRPLCISTGPTWSRRKKYTTK